MRNDKHNHRNQSVWHKTKRILVGGVARSQIPFQQYLQGMWGRWKIIDRVSVGRSTSNNYRMRKWEAYEKKWGQGNFGSYTIFGAR